jgi:hypothetical protein
MALRPDTVDIENMRQSTCKSPRNPGGVARALALCLIGMLVPMHGWAASNTVLAPDSNSRITVENAVVNGATTTVLFWTHPDLGDPGMGEECPLNFYTLELQPGLPDAQPRQVAGKVCGNGLSRARLASTGDLSIVAGGRLEQWRGGERLKVTAFSGVDAMQEFGIDVANGAPLLDLNPAGDVIVSAPVRPPAGQSPTDEGWHMVSLKPGLQPRWRSRVFLDGMRILPGNVWAGYRGNALFFGTVLPADMSRLGEDPMLFFVDEEGRLHDPVKLGTGESMAMQDMLQADEGDLQKLFAQLDATTSEDVRKLAAQAREDGGFDVLLERRSDLQERTGHFLMRFDATGRLQAEYPLTDPIVPHGLERWTDFYVDGEQLVLLASVTASQPAVQSKRKGYMQNVVAEIPLAGGPHTARLIPLDPRYLKAAMDAGDEDIQYLENLPGGTPQRLTRLGPRPLAISLGKLQRRPALRLDESTPDLLAYEEAYQQRQAERAKQQAREQRKSQREASKQAFNADIAAAVGMTPEAFAALSNQERKEAMIHSGNYDAIMAAGMNQAASAQGSGPTIGTGPNSGPGAAQPMAPTQGLPPDMAAQMAAAMAQAQQDMADSGMAVPPELAAMMASVNNAAGGAAATGQQSSVSAPGEGFKMPVMDVFEIRAKGTLLTGIVERGRVKVGDTVCLVTARSGVREVSVEAIQMRNMEVDSAGQGDLPGILIGGLDPGTAEKGDELRSSCATN